MSCSWAVDHPLSGWNISPNMSVFVDNDLMTTQLFIILKRHPDRLKKKLRSSHPLKPTLISSAFLVTQIPSLKMAFIFSFPFFLIFFKLFIQVYDVFNFINFCRSFLYRLCWQRNPSYLFIYFCLAHIDFYFI